MSTTGLSIPSSTRVPQNWVISPGWDLATIIAAPLIWMALFGLLFPLTGHAPLLAFFSIFNVAHHLPTFLRIYGDKDLLQRFRWNILLAPVIPFSFMFLGFAYLMTHEKARDLIVYPFILLSLWDPWHFLMQDYGFVRIYDRPNRAPRSLASWMDYTLCATWFVFVMVGALNWLPEILYELYCNLGIPLLFWFNADIYRGLEMATGGAAIAATVAYLVYLGWCLARGYQISYVKLLFLALAWGTLYLAYVPNRAMQAVFPGWDFRLGFAAIGMVHVSQYLAIVWKYNRGLAHGKGAVRSGLFGRVFSRGGPLVLVGYVLLCAAYGGLLDGSRDFSNVLAPRLLGLAIAVNFTSTLMHYYYDGFIWKIRHKENQQFLDMRKGSGTANPPAVSWWDSFRSRSVLAIAARHLLYFGLPLTLVSVGVAWVHADPIRNPHGRVPRIKELQQQGRIEENLRETDATLAAMDFQLRVEQQMISIRPTAAHYAYAADLIYLKALIKMVYCDPYRPGDPEVRAGERRQEILKAVQAMEQALALGGKLANRGATDLTEQDALERLAFWRWEAGVGPPPHGVSQDGRETT